MADPRALYEQGQAHFAAQRWDEAAACFLAVLDAKPYDARARTALGNTRLAEERLHEAIAAYERASELRPDVGEPHHNRAVALVGADRLDEAVAAFEAAVRADPQIFSWHDDLLQAALDTGTAGRLDALYDVLLADHPDEAAVHYGMARLHQARGDPEAALEALLRAVYLEPERTDLLRQAGWALLGLARPAEAVSFLLRASQADPDHALGLAMLGMARDSARQAGAEAAYRRALELESDLPLALVGLANHLLARQQSDGALSLLRKAQDSMPDHPTVVYGLARVEDQRHHVEQARAMLEPLLAQGSNAPMTAISAAMLARDDTERERAVSLLRTALDAANPIGVERNLRFTLARTLDRLERWEEAFEQATLANALKGDTWAPGDAAREMGRVEASFPVGGWRQAAPAEVPYQPIFIVGMPRSGTSLVEQILSVHPAVDAHGELDDLPRLAAGLGSRMGLSVPWPEVMQLADDRALNALADDYIAAVAPSQARFTDKLPQNFLRVGLIAQAFPGARIVHCRRDMRDTCVSIWFLEFSGHHPYAYDLRTLGEYHRGYQRLMDHWGHLGIDMFDLRYEDLIREPEDTVRRLLSFLDLAWDDRVLGFHRSDREVFTASSQQVREPLYTRSIGRWRPYERWLVPLYGED